MQNLTDKERIHNLEEAIKKLATKDEMAMIVRETMKEVFLTIGKGTKATIITLAVILGSLAVIGGGIKWLLGFIGFSYLK